MTEIKEDSIFDWKTTTRPAPPRSFWTDLKNFTFQIYRAFKEEPKVSTSVVGSATLFMWGCYYATESRSKIRDILGTWGLLLFFSFMFYSSQKPPRITFDREGHVQFNQIYQNNITQKEHQQCISSEYSRNDNSSHQQHENRMHQISMGRRY